MEEKSKIHYNRTLIPLPDVYQRSGTTIFDELAAGKKSDDEFERNLLVVTNETYNQLDSLRNRGSKKLRNNINSFYSRLGSIVTNSESKYFVQKKDEANVLGVNYVKVELPTGLDVLILKENVPRNDLIDKLKKDYSFTENKISYVSTDSKKKADYELDQIPIQYPSFLMGDPSIVKKGLISGSIELQAALAENGGKLSYKDASAFIDVNEDVVAPNILVRLPEEKYAMFRIPVHRNNHGKIIRTFDKEDMTLESLTEQSYSQTFHIHKKPFGKKFYGVAARDMMQYITLQEGLLNHNVSALVITGGAGSGKTLLSYVASIAQTLKYSSSQIKERGWDNPFNISLPKKLNKDDVINPLHKEAVARNGKDGASLYERIILLKPSLPVGGEAYGYVPGNLWDKVKDHLEPYNDAHLLTTFSSVFELKDLVLHPKKKNEYGDQRDPKANSPIKEHGGHLSGEKIPFQMTHAGVFRGRSLENTLVLVDEAQNYPEDVMKTILTRIGVGSKVVIMGDPAQIDSDAISHNVGENGLVYATKHLIKENHSMVVELESHWRSEVAEVFSNIKD